LPRGIERVAGVTHKLAVSVAIIALLVTLGGFVAMAGGDSGRPEPPPGPPPMAWAEQASLLVADQDGGSLVCGGRTVTLGYVNEHVMNVGPVRPPPPGEQEGSSSSSTDPAPVVPGNPVSDQAAGAFYSYVFRCVNDEVVAIPAP
jgi:hypothetical protein